MVGTGLVASYMLAYFVHVPPGPLSTIIWFARLLQRTNAAPLLNMVTGMPDALVG